MLPRKPEKTFADWLVITLSPVLIMLLVGSLCFFLIEVFYRGQAEASLRWVMFWFVLAVVLVSRIGIEQGAAHAAAYGLMLALATWLYLVRIHPAFILGALLLAIVWWCAHQLTWDCTLIDETEDASGGGLLSTVYNRAGFKLFGKKSVTRTTAGKETKAKSPPHPPGRWVVWFSLAALPLFGIGQMLLPRGDDAARSAGFVHLLIYVSAAVGLLLTTSFLGLRRYLRQRYLTMPGLMAFGWIRFGGGLAVLVLVAALLLPRPGATAAWSTLAFHVNYQLHQASEYAARFGPHGQGAGRLGNEPDKSAPQPGATDPSGAQKTPGQSPEKTPDQSGPKPDNPPPAAPPSSSPSPSFDWAKQLYQLFRAAFLLAAAVLIAWWLFRNRAVLLAMAQSLLAALRQFWADLFQWRSPATGEPAPAAPATPPKSQRFATFQNPFLTGQAATWPPEKLVFYSYEALQAWAGEHGLTPRPDQTARELCAELGVRFPEISPELHRLSVLYGQAAYGVTPPPGSDLDPVKKVWQYLTG
jgi:hypothetical protein